MITVFTPTYNRAYCLSRLYQSLCEQTYVDFEWLIIDDGSTDNTKKLINTFRQENKINIRYYYVRNGGKHRAINKAAELSKGELFFIVDSDDYLIPKALEYIVSEWNEISERKGYAGLCFRKILAPSMAVLGKAFPYQKFDADSLELTFAYHGNIDKAEVFRTAVLQKFPFPEIQGENFVPEALVWFRIANTGLKLRCIDTGIYICEYLADGLSRNFKSNLRKNKQGFAMFYRELLSYKQPAFWPDKLKALMRLLQCNLYGLTK